jgi:hypothetical protein
LLSLSLPPPLLLPRAKMLLSSRSASASGRASTRGASSSGRVGAFGRAASSDEPSTRAFGGPFLESLLSRFGPTTDRAPNLTTLDFEKPLLELDKRIKEVRSECRVARGRTRGRAPKDFSLSLPPYTQTNAHHSPLSLFTRAQIPGRTRPPHCPHRQVRKVAEENGVDVTQSIAELETRAQQVRFFRLAFLSKKRVVASARGGGPVQAAGR